MYKLKTTARRVMSFVAAVAMFAGTGSVFLNSAFSYADSLNPLTERSLTLSSSSPGWADTDGSGNSVYAPPNSGANGQKTGNYFSFKVSTNSQDTAHGGTNQPIKAMSFQYCTTSAGLCAAPGNNSPLTGSDDASHSDLNIAYGSAAEISGTDNAGTGTITTTSGSKAVTGTGTSFTSLKVGGTLKTAGGHFLVIAAITDNTHLTLTANAVASESTATFSQSDFDQVVDPVTGVVKAVPGYANQNPKYLAQTHTGDPAEAAQGVAGNVIVMHYNGTVWVQDTGWTISSSNQEEASSQTTGKQNTIILQNSSGIGLATDTPVKVLFFATASNYITNPGAGAFFVKINTFKTFTALAAGTNSLANNVASGDVIDGGVTVANVMNQSIQITTKVLETMQFSVGTVDPDTLTSDGTTGSAFYAATGITKHTPCDIIQTRLTSSDPANVLHLGNQDAESSLETGKAYATHSYWRLSSNSSAGATVYYSGHTLSNTSGDEIHPIGTSAANSAPGSEQFGLAIATAGLTGSPYNTATYGVNYAQDRATNKLWENAADNDKDAVDSSVITDLTQASVLNASYHTPRLDPLVPSAAYAGGSGAINGTDSASGLGTNNVLTTGDTNAAFAFDPMSDTVPAAIATENSQVVDCVTAKMRYIGNIAATTPAGIYTTKINYIAAPQY